MTNAELINNLQGLLKQAMSKQSVIEVKNSKHGSFANRVKEIKALKLNKKDEDILIEHERQLKQKAIAKELPQVETPKIVLPAQVKLASKQTAKANAVDLMANKVPLNHIFFIPAYTDTELKKALSKENLSLNYAIIGSIKQLMNSYNVLYMSSEKQSDKNVRVIKSALKVLETDIDRKIENLNKFYEGLI